jgi:hypothetical protein
MGSEDIGDILLADGNQLIPFNPFVFNSTKFLGNIQKFGLDTPILGTKLVWLNCHQ